MTTVIQYGVGAIGREIAKLLIERDHDVLGAIDQSDELIGRDLGELLGGSAMDVSIDDDAERVLAHMADVVMHSTRSRLDEIAPDIRHVLAAGSNLISTCEELAYPAYRHAGLAAEVHERAVKHGVTVLGTGVNPGFVMDYWPLVMSSACRRIDAIRVERAVDARQRRYPLQKKIGAGLSPEDFQKTVGSGGGHVGLAESVALLAAGLRVELDGIRETIEPVVADTPVASEFFQVDPGQVLGLHQQAHGTIQGQDVITLDLTMALGASNRDRVLIEGEPPLDVTVANGIHGDVATASVAVNMIPRVLEAPPGLVTMKDLPPAGSVVTGQLHQD